MDGARAHPPGSVREVASVFLKLGFIGFGGPAAHLALMRDECVHRRRWIDDAEFVDLVGATNLVPGPNSTEMAIHLGHRRAGWRGFAVAGVCFISPAVAIVLVLAWAYRRWGVLPVATDLRAGVVPVILAVIVQALWALGRSSVRSAGLAVVAAGSAAAWWLGANEIVILLAAALAWALVRRGGSMLVALVPAGGLASTGSEVDLPQLFAVMLKAGALLYGSGYVLIAFLEGDLVARLGWLSSRQLLDAVVIGQVTPGPLFTTATFVGYQLAGLRGAAVATVGIFLPAFVFVALLTRIVPAIRRSPTASAALDGVNAASVGLLVAVSARLGLEALSDVLAAVTALAALVVLLRWRPNTVWLVATGLVVGLGRWVW